MTYKRTEKVNGKYRFIHELECLNCREFYERVGANKKPIKNGHCSKECRKELFKKTSWTVNTCTQCKKEFKTQRSRRREFCSHECYHADMKDNPERYNLFEKARNMGKYANTERSVEKGKETKVKNGVMVDWKDATWKQFWRKCNNLTRKKRQELLESWDGYDYIDGEYIRSYLDLPYFHKNYPTLDHVKPRSAFFKEGRTPEEACATENLKWTKRTNNSRKYNRYDT